MGDCKGNKWIQCRLSITQLSTKAVAGEPVVFEFFNDNLGQEVGTMRRRLPGQFEGSVDWGDKKPKDKLDTGRTRLNHTYDRPGPYTVKAEISGQFKWINYNENASCSYYAKTMPASEGVSVSPAPPKTSASLEPPPNASGWNKSNVTVTLNAVAAQSSVVKQIHYGASGSQPIVSTTIPGASASFAVNKEGLTQVGFYADSDTGASETVNMLTVKLDKTPPTISASATPNANANGWNKTDVSVTYKCADAVSGLAPGSPPAPSVLALEGADQSASGKCFDVAGNAAEAIVKSINIDKTPPVLTATLSPTPNSNGWNRSDVTVTFQATDPLSGVATVSVPSAITTEGKQQPVSGRATDRADNVSSLSVLVSLDRTPPEVRSQFDVEKHDFNLEATDSLSGIAAGQLTPEISWHRHFLFWTWEHRSYRVMDLADNSLVLDEKIVKTKKSFVVKITGCRYNNDAVAPEKNRQKNKWRLESDGRLAELKQELTLGSGQNRRQTTFTFNVQDNLTTVKDSHDTGVHTSRPGLVVPRVATERGKLSLQF